MNGFIIYINEPRSISLSKVKLKHFINETDIDVSLFKGVHRKDGIFKLGLIVTLNYLILGIWN